MQKTASSRPSLSRRLFALTLTLAVSLCLLAGSVPARASTQERSLFPNSLQAKAHPQKLAVATSAAVEPAKVVEFQLSLRMRNFAKLQARLSAGEHVSKKEMQEQFYPTVADYQAVVTWAEAQGLTVMDKDPLRLGVRLSGTVATVEKVLATKYAHVSVDGQDYLAAQTVPSLPTRVAAPVLGINGLEPYLKAQVHSIQVPFKSGQSGVRPMSTTAKFTVPYVPSDILAAYNAAGITGADGATLDGTGQTIAILIDTVPLESDLETFWANTKIPQSFDNITEINVNDAVLPAPTGEETLDVSWSSGIASGAQVRVYAVGSLFQTDIDRGYQRIISDKEQGIGINELSLSFGAGEIGYPADELNTDAQYFATLASQGVSVFVSTGDSGSDPNGVIETSYPSTDPSVTAVGGTSLLINTITGRVSSETVWNGNGATGGGASILFSIPVYQSGNGITGTARLVPDVSSVGDPQTGCYLYLNGAATQFGGTSWSAPTWAGFCALINQAREAAGLPDVGLLNPSLYPLVDTPNFRDIVFGDNYVGTHLPGEVVPYPATAGYDEASGLGVPVVSSLAATLTTGGDLAVTEFNPVSGVPGTQVTISGTGLDRASSVSFNGTSAVTFSDVSSVQLLATVPDGATTGPITVADRLGNTASSATSFTVLPADAGANDNFAAAQVLGPATTQVTGTNVGATKETGEPDHAGNPGGASIWYRWTAPLDGTYTFNTIRSSFDTLLAVYTGTNVAELTEVVSDDNFGNSIQSSVVFNATYNTTYYIAVDGARQGNGAAAQGTVILNLVSEGSEPVLNDFTPAQGSVGQSVRLLGENFLTVSGVSFNGTPATFHTDSSTQITTVIPTGATTGPITLTDTLGDRATSSGIFTVVPVPANDDFANATTLTGTAPTAAGTNVGATKQTGEPDHADNAGGASVWFTWTAPASGVYTVSTSGSNFDTLLAVYTGDAVAALTPVASNDDAGPLGISSVTFNVVGGTVYHVAIDGFDGATGNYRLNVQAASGTPAITALSPGTGGAGVDVAITGTGLLTTNRVTFNGVAAPGFVVNSDGLITVTVPTGATTGYVVVTALDGTATSPAVFTILPTPANDNFANSALLSGAAPLTATGYTDGATKEAGEPTIIPGDTGGHSIWYTWTPPASGQYLITTRGSDFDTLLGVYTGTTVTNLQPVAANDDDPEGGITSAVTLNAVRDTTYRIVVDGANGDAGNVVLGILNSTATINLYNTGFEASEGFSIKLPLVGQNGWVAQDGVTGGNGLISGVIPNQGQQAFVGGGGLPLSDGAGALAVYHPFTYPPVSGTYPVVNFSTLVRFANSTNGQHDMFGFSPYGVLTSRGDITDTIPENYFTLLFDEATGGISYQLDDGAAAVPTGATFSNDVTYSLQMTLDFQNNVWNATLNGKTVVTNQPLTTFSVDGYVPSTLTRIAADWFVTNPATPGDNYMAFDQYTVNTPAAQAPAILVQPSDQTVTSGSTVSFSVVAAGTPDLTYQWYFNGVAIPGENAMQPTYTLALINTQNAGRYTVRVTNQYGNVLSLDAFLVISTTQAPVTAVVQNNEQVPQVTASSGQIGSVLLTRTGDLSGTLTVSYMVHGTAQPGIDYVALSGTANIKAGRAKKRIKIVPIDRGIRDGSSVKVVIKVVGDNGYSAGSTPKQKVFIIRD